MNLEKSTMLKSIVKKKKKKIVNNKHPKWSFLLSWAIASFNHREMIISMFSQMSNPVPIYQRSGLPIFCEFSSNWAVNKSLNENNAIDQEFERLRSIGLLFPDSSNTNCRAWAHFLPRKILAQKTPKNSVKMPGINTNMFAASLQKWCLRSHRLRYFRYQISFVTDTTWPISGFEWNSMKCRRKSPKTCHPGNLLANKETYTWVKSWSTCETRSSNMNVALVIKQSS